MMAAQVDAHADLRPRQGDRALLQSFERGVSTSTAAPNYDVSPSTGRFLMAKEPERTRGERLVVVMNWFEELKAKMPS